MVVINISCQFTNKKGLNAHIKLMKGMVGDCQGWSLNRRGRQISGGLVREGAPARKGECLTFGVGGILNYSSLISLTLAFEPV